MLLIEMTMQQDLSLNVKEWVFKLRFVFIMGDRGVRHTNDISRSCRRADESTSGRLIP
jgi:hypothetical protein